MNKKKTNLINLTKIGIVAGLYVALSVLLAPASFGALQFRISESFNHLAIMNKRYIWAVTLGCALANMFSPLGIIDIIVGSSSTLVMLGISYFVTKKIESVKKRMVINTLICSTIGMVPIALELMFIFHLPLVMTFLGLVASEVISMAVGGIVIYQVNKRIDLTK